MNDKNVEALLAVLMDANRESYQLPDDRSCFIDMAEFMASRGVLVPGALTTEQCADMTFGWDDGSHWNGAEKDNEVGAATMRDALERIAKGEPPTGGRPR